VIVPDPLVEHWREQVERHTEPWVFPRAYYDPNVVREKAHKRRVALPPAHELARCDLVVVAKSTLTVEWLRGKPRCMLDVRTTTTAPHHTTV
jgi:hypothetical protein